MQRKGFTIVELLVVIGIITVLVAILMPALSRARQAAMSAGCLSNLRQIGIAVQQYVTDYNGYMPLEPAIGYTTSTHRVWSTGDNMGYDPRNSNYPYTILAFLDYEYLKNPAVFVCPAADLSQCKVSASYPYDFYASCYGVSTAECDDGAAFSYATVNASGSTYPNTFTTTWLKLSQIGNPTERLMAADKGGVMFADGSTNNWIDIRRGNDGIVNSVGSVDNSARHGGNAVTATNYLTNGLVNFVCVDGHAETRSFTEVQQPAMYSWQTGVKWNWLGSAPY